MTKLLSITAITLVAIVMGMSTIAPAMAATKVTEIKTITPDAYTLNVCGVDSDITTVFTMVYTEWDNGKFNTKTKWIGTAIDSTTGKLVAKGSSITSESGNVADLPYTFQLNHKVTCVGTGMLYSIHEGVTVHRDGTATLHHN